MTAQTDTTPHTDTTHVSDLERPSAEVYDRIQMLRLVEDALQRASWCNCGAQLTVDVDHGTLWLECPTFMEPSTGRLAWLRDGIRIALHQKQAVARGVDFAA